jgi:hypothetical protein
MLKPEIIQTVVPTIIGEIKPELISELKAVIKSAVITLCDLVVGI